MYQYWELSNVKFTVIEDFWKCAEKGWEMVTKEEQARRRGISDRLKQVRLARGYKKQKDVYGPTGLTSSGYSVFEGGIRPPSHAALVKLADFLECPLEFLLAGDPERLDAGLRTALKLDAAPAKAPPKDRKAEIKALVNFVQSEAQRSGDEISADEVIERVVAHMLDRS